jgi:aspartyl-tRNA(Asn)/glutamyl-tRNA(Gln) amidotransferase subunit C
MSLDEATVARIGQLARIAIDDQERALLAGELSHILGWIEQLNELDTEGVPPMTSVTPMRLALREDEVKDGGRQDDILKNAPDRQNGFFVVPKVVE